MSLNSDIGYYYSGGSANTSGAASLGDAISTHAIGSGNGNLFPNVALDEAVAGSSSYLCIYLKNNGSVAHTGLGLYFESTPIGTDDTVFVSLGLAAVNATETSVSTINTSPAGIIWQQPNFNYSAIAFPDLNPGDYQAIWLYRNIAVVSSGSVLDYVRLALSGT
jgi:hypothetical protein